MEAKLLLGKMNRGKNFYLLVVRFGFPTYLCFVTKVIVLFRVDFLN